MKEPLGTKCHQILDINPNFKMKRNTGSFSGFYSVKAEGSGRTRRSARTVTVLRIAGCGHVRTHHATRGAGCNQSTHLYLPARWVPQLCALGFTGVRQMRTLSSQCHFLFTGCRKNQLSTTWIFFFFLTESIEEAAGESSDGASED